MLKAEVIRLLNFTFEVAGIQVYISMQLFDHAEHICIAEKPQMVCEHIIMITQLRRHKPQIEQGFRVSHDQLQHWARR